MSEDQSDAPDVSTLVWRVLEAIAAKDVDKLQDCWHDDVVEDFIVLGPVTGKPAAAAFFAELFGAMPDMDYTIERVMAVDATTAVGEWSLQGTFDGTPFQGIEPSGREITLRGIDVMEFEHGLLRHNTIYCDGLAFARQVGLLPAAGSTADQLLVTAFNGMVKAKRAVLQR